MKKIFSNTALFFLTGAFLLSCAGPKPRLIDPSFQAMDLNSKLQAGEYKQKVDNFYVISDRSGSKGKTYQRQMKFDISYDFLSRMNSSIPDMELTSAIRTFGASFNPFAKETHLIYGPTSYSKQGFQEALGSGYQKSGGLSPADKALDAANTDMLPFQGKTALVFVGDGQYKDNEALSGKRAMAAKQFLLDQGIPEDRISTSSFGYSMPAATNETEWGRSENRRDEFKWSR